MYFEYRDNIGYHGKLDWIIYEMERFKIIETIIGGQNASDHKFIGISLIPK